ncbi:Methylated DNA-protein cysteine methyltransferase [Elusimicrobium minutum Pei191]|uniref:Methylated-DNA--protein-cysteine methyltransferase n=1 Tax=Elusimicrobium minutum (strain Pei191) TaxID=445932 RepID=B2KD64_ELUMP|nr:methylated-DNA--[protein]-cysteine S-methyltransferase [Elusimicrobium minutum]ACC98460.1 Methylated DNA-protein cysteine methyltransferase [Elusimicrobium minutum Pei191]
MSTKYFLSFKTPVGILELTSNDTALIGIYFTKTVKESKTLPPILKSAKKQLLEYFDGKRKDFDLLLDFGAGISPFRLKAWKEMAKIPFGKTYTYGQLAAKAGNAKASRAAGGACNKNPFMIVVPCHRVLGSNGSLTGYAGGLNVKKFLLDLEGISYK